METDAGKHAMDFHAIHFGFRRRSIELPRNDVNLVFFCQILAGFLQCLFCPESGRKIIWNYEHELHAIIE